MESSSLDRYFKKPTTVDHVTALLNDERTHNIRQEGNTFIVYEKERMGGFTRPMRKKFFPDYEEVKKRRSTRSGKKTGERVHRQVYHMIECVGRKGGNCDCTVKTNPKKLNKWTVQCLDKLKSLEITPAAAEVPIFSKRGRRCTKLDLVGWRWKGKPQQRSLVISLKTGYSSCYDVDRLGQRMKPPLDDIPSIPKNHNQLQGLLEYATLDEEYKLRFDDYLILYLGHGDDGKVKTEYLDDWCMSESTRRDAYSEFCK